MSTLTIFRNKRSGLSPQDPNERHSLSLDVQHLLERGHTLFSLSFLPLTDNGIHQGQPYQQHTSGDLATAAAFVIGCMARAVQSLVLLGAGVALVIIFSWPIGNLHSVTISSTTNAQIIGRISPKITDLNVALASGAAGAFAISGIT